MRIAVTGTQGQLVRALAERAGVGVEVLPCGRPQLDLLQPNTVLRCLRELDPDIIVSAAAYTQVDQAESEPDLAFAINRNGAAAVAEASASLGIPIIHISTDYVFDGQKADPYSEEDMPAPSSVYGTSKLEGERAVRACSSDHVILRTSWVYSPFGRNFLKTMLRLAQNRDSIEVVDDQIGSPTCARDFAGGVLAVAGSVLDHPCDRSLFGTFHITGSGTASWADFAEAIMQASCSLGGPSVPIKRVPSAAYPTPVRRPLNSRLCNDKLARTHGVMLPHWRQSIRSVVQRELGVGVLV